MTHMEATGERLYYKNDFVNDTRLLSYLDGELYIQLYGRPKTAELRLMGARRTDGSYGIRHFSPLTIEDTMAMFNTVYRNHANFTFGGSKTFLTNDAVPQTYEAVSEYAIIWRCCRILGSRSLADQRKMHGIISDSISMFIAKDTLTCPLKSAERQFRDDPRVRKNPRVYALLNACITEMNEKYPGRISSNLMLHSVKKKQKHRL